MVSQILSISTNKMLNQKNKQRGVVVSSNDKELIVKISNSTINLSPIKDVLKAGEAVMVSFNKGTVNLEKVASHLQFSQDKIKYQSTDIVRQVLQQIDTVKSNSNYDSKVLQQTLLAIASSFKNGDFDIIHLEKSIETLEKENQLIKQNSGNEDNEIKKIISLLSMHKETLKDDYKITIPIYSDNIKINIDEKLDPVIILVDDIDKLKDQLDKLNISQEAIDKIKIEKSSFVITVTPGKDLGKSIVGIYPEKMETEAVRNFQEQVFNSATLKKIAPEVLLEILKSIESSDKETLLKLDKLFKSIEINEELKLGNNKEIKLLLPQLEKKLSKSEFKSEYIETKLLNLGGEKLSQQLHKISMNQDFQKLDPEIFKIIDDISIVLNNDNKKDVIPTLFKLSGLSNESDFLKQMVTLLANKSSVNSSKNNEPTIEDIIRLISKEDADLVVKDSSNDVSEKLNRNEQVALMKVLNSLSHELYKFSETKEQVIQLLNKINGFNLLANSDIQIKDNNVTIPIKGDIKPQIVFIENSDSLKTFLIEKGVSEEVLEKMTKDDTSYLINIEKNENAPISNLTIYHYKEMDEAIRKIQQTSIKSTQLKSLPSDYLLDLLKQIEDVNPELLTNLDSLLSTNEKDNSKLSIADGIIRILFPQFNKSENINIEIDKLFVAKNDNIDDLQSDNPAEKNDKSSDILNAELLKDKENVISEYKAVLEKMFGNVKDRPKNLLEQFSNIIKKINSYETILSNLSLSSKESVKILSDDIINNILSQIKNVKKIISNKNSNLGDNLLGLIRALSKGKLNIKLLEKSIHLLIQSKNENYTNSGIEGERVNKLIETLSTLKNGFSLMAENGKVLPLKNISTTVNGDFKSQVLIKNSIEEIKSVLDRIGIKVPILKNVSSEDAPFMISLSPNLNEEIANVKIYPQQFLQKGAKELQKTLFQSAQFKSVSSEILLEFIKEIEEIKPGAINILDSIYKSYEGSFTKLEISSEFINKLFPDLLINDSEFESVKQKLLPLMDKEISNEILDLIKSRKIENIKPQIQEILKSISTLMSIDNKKDLLPVFFKLIGLANNNDLFNLASMEGNSLSDLDERSNLKSSLLKILHHINKLEGDSFVKIQNNQNEGKEPSPNSLDDDFKFSAIKKQVSQLIEKIEAFQILTKKVSTPLGDSQLISLPVNFGGEWVDLQLKVTHKKRDNDNNRNKGHISLELNVELSAIGEVAAEMQYYKNKGLTINLTFKNMKLVDWFEKKRADIESALSKLNLNILQLNFRTDKYYIKKPKVLHKESNSNYDFIG